ncbi:MAG TPA: hypothetical protein VHN99_00550 [Deinococcales bacterium]|nr:hypothetical protein [Deinococcales bacterium]
MKPGGRSGGWAVVAACAALSGLALAVDTIGPVQPKGQPVLTNPDVNFTFGTVQGGVDAGGYPYANLASLQSTIEGNTAACFRADSVTGGAAITLGGYAVDAGFVVTTSNANVTVEASYDQALPANTTLKVLVVRYDWVANVPTPDTTLRTVGSTATPQVIADSGGALQNLVLSDNTNNLGSGKKNKPPAHPGYTFGLRYYLCLDPGANESGSTIPGMVTLSVTSGN